MKLIRFIVMLLTGISLIIGLVSFSFANGISTKPIKPKPQLQYPVEHKLGHFSSIHIEQGINVDIIGGQKESSVQVIGAPVNLISAKVKRGVLEVGGNEKWFKKHLNTKVVVKTSHVYGLYVRGNGNVLVTHVDHSPLTIEKSGRGSLRMTGEINLRHLINHGDGRITLYWISSDNLNIKSAGNGTIRLAGEVKTLHAKISNDTYLEAQYLRAHTAFIQTSDRAIAKVLPLDTLNAFAAQRSFIYYFKAPQHLVAGARQGGDILQLNFWG